MRNMLAWISNVAILDYTWILGAGYGAMEGLGWIWSLRGLIYGYWIARVGMALRRLLPVEDWRTRERERGTRIGVRLGLCFGQAAQPLSPAP